MTSNLCSKGYRPAARLFGSALKRQVAITSLVTVFMLLLCPGTMLPQALKEGAREISLDYQLVAWPVAILLLSVVLGIILLCYNNLHLFSRQSADLYYSLPIKRDTLLLTRFGASAVGAAFAMTASFSGLVFINALPQVNGIGFGQMLKLYVLMLLLLLLCLSAILILLVNSGGVFHFIFSLFVVCGGLPLLAVMAYAWYTEAAVGVVDGGTWLQYVSPFGYAVVQIIKQGDFIEKGRVVLGLAPVLVSLGGILLFGGIAFLMNHRRKAERSGDSFAFAAPSWLIAFLASSLGGYVVGLIFQTDYDTYAMDFWFPFSVGAAIFAVAAGAIVSKGFRKIWRWFLCAGVATVLVIGMFLTADGLGKAERQRIPNLSRIEKITIGETYSAPKVTLTKNFDLVLKLHEHMIGEKTADDRYSSDYFSTEMLNGSFEITYELRNGKTVRRSYYINDYEGFCMLLDIAQTDEYTAAWENLADINGLSSVEVGYVNYASGEKNVRYAAPNEVRRLLRIYSEELREADESVLSCGDNYVRISLEGKGYREFAVPLEFTRTLALLEELMK